MRLQRTLSSATKSLVSLSELLGGWLRLKAGLGAISNHTVLLAMASTTNVQNASALAPSSSDATYLRQRGGELGAE